MNFCYMNYTKLHVLHLQSKANWELCIQLPTDFRHMLAINHAELTVQVCQNWKLIHLQLCCRHTSISNFSIRKAAENIRSLRRRQECGAVRCRRSCSRARLTMQIPRLPKRNSRTSGRHRELWSARGCSPTHSRAFPA